MRVNKSDNLISKEIPDDAFEALARCLYPAIVAYYDSDAGNPSLFVSHVFLRTRLKAFDNFAYPIQQSLIPVQAQITFLMYLCTFGM